MMTSRSVFGLFWSLLLSFPEMCLGTVEWVMTWRGIWKMACLDVEAGGKTFVRAASPDKGRPSEGTSHVGLHSLCHVQIIRPVGSMEKPLETVPRDPLPALPAPSPSHASPRLFLS